MSSMERIVFVCLRLSEGGAERVISILANHFAEIGHPVETVLLLDEPIVYQLDDRIVVHRLQWNSTKSIREYARRVMQMRSFFRGGGCIVISFLFRAIFWATIGSVFTKTKRIVSERNDPRRDPNKWFKRILRDVCYAIADTVVFQTVEQKKHFPSAIQKKGRVIPNPVSDNLPEHKISICENTIISACRYEKQKNILMGIKAFAVFHETHKEYQYHIYGEGSQREELENYIKENNLSDSVKLKGFANNIHEIISRSALFISSSDYEGISNSILEALSMGVPAICTDCPIGGTRELIKDGKNGLLVEVGNIQQLSRKMCELIDNTEERIRISNCAKDIKYRYSKNEICHRWETVVRSVV